MSRTLLCCAWLAVALLLPTFAVADSLDGVPVQSASSTLQPVNGLIDIPTEPGLGVEFDPDFLNQATEI